MGSSGRALIQGGLCSVLPEHTRAEGCSPKLSSVGHTQVTIIWFPDGSLELSPSLRGHSGCNQARPFHHGTDCFRRRSDVVSTFRSVRECLSIVGSRGCLDWELKQLRGDYMRRCQRTVQLLSFVDVLSGIGIRTVFLPNDAEVLLDDVVMQRENDYSWHAAGFTLGLVGARLRRGLELLRGWPQRAALMASEASGQQFMDMLKHDFEL